MTRCVVPFTELNRRTVETVQSEWPMVEFRSVAGDELKYWQLLRQLVVGGEPFVVVEHDMVVPEGAAASLDACPEPWCTWEYDTIGIMITEALGIVRFRPDLLPENFLKYNPVSWVFLDTTVRIELRCQGFVPHVHGRADHLHVYPKVDQWTLDEDGNLVVPHGWRAPTIVEANPGAMIRYKDGRLVRADA
jgi:hypothetical protein